MTGIIHNLISLALATGSLFAPARQSQDLLDHYTGAVFLASYQSGDTQVPYTGCDLRLYAGHSNRAFGIMLKERINSGHYVQFGNCTYQVIERKIVRRKDYSLKFIPGISWMQTCWTDDASEILIITIRGVIN